MQEGLIREVQSHLLVSCTRATKPISGSWGVICSTEGGGGATEASPQDHKKHRETEEGGECVSMNQDKESECEREKQKRVGSLV